ncbi:YcgN family cysteine cluster protein [Desulfosarcina sp.]|uniref:YcgN family cysteine cluster protein n=1 Tax=Desulfosarcina sp. TaxID=2027861 RepID=UPI003970A052
MKTKTPPAFPRAADRPFWKTAGLEQMSPEQWESLCDGCGRCCLQKFKDGKTGKVTYTWVACHLLDVQACRCSAYGSRTTRVPDCLVLTPEQIPRLRWLPRTCAYRRLSEGKDLHAWHPLVSGDPESVHRAGISVRGKALSETDVHPEDVDFYAIGYRI